MTDQPGVEAHTDPDAHTSNAYPGAVGMIPSRTGLLAVLDTDAELRSYSRQTMVLLSHAIEEPFERGEVSGILLAGFQRISLALPALNRYRRIAAHAEVVHIWACRDVPLPSDLPPNLIVHELGADDPLAQTWFVVAYEGGFHSALLAEEIPSAAGARRTFHGGWTTSRRAVARAVAWLAAMTGLPELRAVDELGSDTPGGLQDRLVRRTHRRLLRHLDRSVTDQRTLAAVNARLYQREQELRNESERLRKLQRLLSDTTVHDLRNSLTTTVGCLEMLLDGGANGLSDSQRELASLALSGAFQASSLSQTVLDVARFEAGEFTISPAVLTLRDIDIMIDSAVAPRRILGQQIDVHIDATLPPFLADGDLIERVLGNLLDNAARYARGSRVVIEAKSVADTVRLTVRDFGPGVPAAASARVFEEFGRGADGDGPRGTGLGLAFCRLVAEAHGGTIDLESPEDGGARFVVALPLDRPSPMNAD